MKKIFLVFLLIGAISGCSFLSPFMLISPIIQGYIMWKDGEATKYYRLEPYQTYHFLKIVLNDLGHKIITDEIQKNGSFYIVSQSKNHKFKINVVNADIGITALKIRIDFMGDKPYAELIYHNLDQKFEALILPIKTP